MSLLISISIEEVASILLHLEQIDRFVTKFCS